MQYNAMQKNGNKGITKMILYDPVQESIVAFGPETVSFSTAILILMLKFCPQSYWISCQSPYEGMLCKDSIRLHNVITV